MRIYLDGVLVGSESARELRIEVAPEGETVGPWIVAFVGGPLTVRGDARDVAGVFLDFGGLAKDATGAALRLEGHQRGVAVEFPEPEPSVYG